ncbi:MAG: hypothetical protein KKG59_01575 [Nanoarchaeota archaeon]|nr:hypothetical protein [Nanoarchaeota archaeon]
MPLALVGFTYLVTKDIVETLQNKLRFELDENTIQRIRQIEDEFLSEFWEYVPDNVDKVELSASELADILASRMNGWAPVLSLDRVYFRNADCYLDVTRVTDPKTGAVVLGPRPGSLPLEEQISEIPYDKVVLTDVGAFEGDTLIGISEALAARNIQVGAAYLGVSDESALKKVGKTLPTLVLNTFRLYEWIELRDLLGIDGRIVASEGTRKFIPYWENLEEWASIPSESVSDVNKLCKSYNLELVGALTGYDLTRIGEKVIK